jgi:hypothetical protein
MALRLATRVLTELQREAIRLIGVGTAMGEVASKIGCPLSLLWDWYYEPAFAAALRTANEARQQLAFARQVSLVESALTVVQECLADENPSIRLKAAKMVLDGALADREDTEEELKQVQVAFARDLLRQLIRVPAEDLHATVKLLASRAESS